MDNFRIPVDLWTPTPLVSDSFNRANGAIGTSDGAGCEETAAQLLAWESGGSTWTVSSNEAINTPTLESDELTNGDMESGDPPSNWTANNATTAADADAHGGSQANLVTATDAFGGAQQVITLTEGTWYLFDGWVKVTNNEGRLVLQENGGDYTVYLETIFTVGSYTQGVRSWRCSDTGVYAYLAVNTLNDAALFDDVSLKPITLNTLFTDVDDSATSDVIVTVETTVPTAQGGIVMNLDDKDTPANFVIAYYDRNDGKAKLDKCVAGTYTSVIATTWTYAAGAELRVIKSGTSYTLYYNNNKIGSTSTISDAGIIDNTKHGLFSTYSANTLDNFYVFATGTGGEYSDLDAW
jgi:hypothetical protein